MSPRALLLSAYAARSHKHWARAMQQMLPEWQWEVLELPPRHFSWRVRGNPLYWALERRGQLAAGHDLLVATSMVDLATLRGLVPELAALPTLLYFHENQFAYPASPRQHSLLEAQMVSLYSALAADRLAFNSAWNRDSFLQGCAALLRRLPDCVPAGVVDALAARSEVLPVPIDPPAESEQAWWPGSAGDASSRPLRLLWLGRLEYDKGLEGLLAVMDALAACGPPLELAVVGQEFRELPPALAALKARHAQRLVHCGNLPDRGQYLGLLRGADVVLSTALHEFQGLALLEAVARGCRPVVPARLVYPELYPEASCYPVYPGDPRREAEGAAERIRQLAHPREQIPGMDVSFCYPRALAPRYREVLLRIASGRLSR